MYIITYTGNWNDEINVDGFAIISDKKKNRIVKLLTDYDNIIYINNGGDDEIEYENGKELLDEISFEKITRDEISVITKFFGRNNDYGNNFLLNIDKISDEYSE